MPDWDERYRRGEHINYEPAPLLLQAAAGLPPGQALDVACGTGRNALWLARQGWQVTAVDASAVGVGLAQDRAGSLAVDWRVADLERGEFVIAPESYDLICVFYYLQRGLFPAVCAGLRPGGLFAGAIHIADGHNDMNPAFLLQPGELRGFFPAWRILYHEEGASKEDGHCHATAEIIAAKAF
jgi:SAM-dependent methyltransferase